MKKFGFILIAFFISSFAFCENVSAPVTQIILSPTIHSQSMQILGMSSIDVIYTAGKYAYAVNYEKGLLAIYDGSKWSKALSIPGMPHIYRVYPAYPQTGKLPGLWIMENDLKQTAVSYFNGKTFSSPQSIASILNVHITSPMMRTSDGYAYIIANDGNTTHYAISQKDGAKFVNVGTLPISVDNFDAFSDNDNAPLAQLTYRKDNKLGVITLIPGKKPVFQENFLSASSNWGSLLISGNKTYLNYGDNLHSNPNKQYIAISDHKNIPEKWQYINDIQSFASLYPANENDGLLCKFVYNPGVSQQSLVFSCLDANNPSPNWKPSIYLTTPQTDWNYVLRKNGAWISYYSRPQHEQYQTHIIDYDYQTNKITDTRFPFPYPHNYADSMTTFIHGVDSDTVIACSFHKNETKPIALFVYNHNHANLGWQKIQGSTNVTICGYSFGGYYEHYLNHADPSKNETLWLFNNQYYSEYNLQKINK